MQDIDRYLVQRLGIAVLVKLGLLAAIWWVFVHPYTVHVSADRLLRHELGAPASQGDVP